MKEIWKDIINYEGLYQVSNLGRFKCMERVVERNGSLYIRKGRISNLTKTIYGYYRVSLRKDYKYTHMLLHRLVAIAFIPNLENKKQINHKNGIKNDNMIQNLEWCTNQENTQHSYDYLGRKGACLGKLGKDHHSSKVVFQLDKDTGVVINTFHGTHEVQRKTNYNYTNIAYACRNGTSSNGYKWKYKN